MSNQIASGTLLWSIVLVLVLILLLDASFRMNSGRSTHVSIGKAHSPVGNEGSVNSQWKQIAHSSSLSEFVHQAVSTVNSALHSRRRLQATDPAADLDLEAENAKGPGFLATLNKRQRKRQQQGKDSSASGAGAGGGAEERDTSKPAILRCHNQTQCIPPKLQLQRPFNVYYCKHIAYGVRFYYLIREGLLLHPLINLVDSPEAADYLVYLPVSAEWEKSECNKDAFRGKTIVLDEGDWPQLFDPPAPASEEKFPLYFKRSCKYKTTNTLHMHTCKCFIA